MAVEQVVCSECGGRGAFSRGPYPATKCNYCGGKGYVVVTAKGPATAMVAVKRENLEKAIELLHANGDRMIAQLLESDLTQSQGE